MKYFNIQITNNENVSFNVPFAYKNCQKNNAIRHAVKRGILNRHDRKFVSNIREIDVNEYNTLIRC